MIHTLPMRAWKSVSLSFEARRKNGEHLGTRMLASSMGVVGMTTFMEHKLLPHPEVLDRACDRASKDAPALIHTKGKNYG